MTCLIGQGVKDHALPVPIILFKMRKTAPAMPIFLCSGTTYVVPYSSDVWLAASLSLLALFRRFLSDGPSMANDDVSEPIITRPKSDASARKKSEVCLGPVLHLGVNRNVEGGFVWTAQGRGFPKTATPEMCRWSTRNSLGNNKMIVTKTLA
jgi:hypothetical protein